MIGLMEKNRIRGEGMTHSERHKDLKNLLDSVAVIMFGGTLTAALERNDCVNCGKKATKFKDGIGEKEYMISGFCQKCQDRFFDSEGKSTFTANSLKEKKNEKDKQAIKKSGH